MKRIVFTNQAGGVSVIIPAFDDPIGGQQPKETNEEYLARIVDRNIEVGNMAAETSWKSLEHTDLPSRVYRSAWQFDGNAVLHDMAVARQMKIDEEIRPERDKRLREKDIEFSRALGKKNETAADSAEAAREILRDIPSSVIPDLDLITDPDILKEWQPQWP